MHFEAENLEFVPCRAFLGHQGGIHLEEDVGERSSEVGTVDGSMFGGLGAVDVLAFGTEEFDMLHPGDVGKTGREKMSGGAMDARAFAEFAFLVLVQLRSEVS